MDRNWIWKFLGLVAVSACAWLTESPFVPGVEAREQQVPKVEPQAGIQTDSKAAKNSNDEKSGADARQDKQADAGERQTEAVSEPQSASAEQLAKWIQELVDPKFAIRQLASQKLIEAGAPAMKAVAQAAESKNLELITRCLGVLTEGLSADAEATRASAREGLEKLARSQNNSVAQRAQQSLDTPVGPLPSAVIRRGRKVPGGVQVVNNVAIRVQVNNGQREMRIVENGKEVVIKDNNGKDITVTVTETVNGVQNVTTVTAKDVDDLKTNNPDAHAYYARFAKGNGLQFKIGGNPGNIPAPPVPRLPRFVNPLKAGDLFDEVDQLRQKLESANSRLEKMSTGEQVKPSDLKVITDEIKQSLKRLAEIKGEAEMP